MKKIFIAVALVITLLLGSFASGADIPVNKEKSIYPTVVLYFNDGIRANITGKVWAQTIFPIVVGMIHKYNWEKKIKYLFFDKSLKGLNPFGLDFVRAMESHPYSEFENNFPKLVGDALKSIYNLDSDRDGYTNIEELNAGTYPGDPSDHPGLSQKKFWDEYGGYIIMITIIASIFVLYFVFNREEKD